MKVGHRHTGRDCMRGISRQSIAAFTVKSQRKPGIQKYVEQEDMVMQIEAP